MSFDLNGSTQEAPAPQSVKYNEKATEPDAPEYTDNLKGFKCWTTDIEGTTKFKFNTPITDDITLYAAWETPVTVTFYNGSTVVGTKTVGKGGKLSDLLALPADDDTHEYIGWGTKNNDVSSKVTKIDNVSEDMSLYALYNPILTDATSKKVYKPLDYFTMVNAGTATYLPMTVSGTTTFEMKFNFNEISTNAEASPGLFLLGGFALKIRNWEAPDTNGLQRGLLGEGKTSAGAGAWPAVRLLKSDDLDVHVMSWSTGNKAKVKIDEQEKNFNAGSVVMPSDGDALRLFGGEGNGINVNVHYIKITTGGKVYEYVPAVEKGGDETKVCLFEKSTKSFLS